QPLCRKVLQFHFRGKRIPGENDPSGSLPAQPRVFERKSDRLCDGRVTQENVIDLTWRDLLTTAIDDFLSPTCEEQIMLGIKETLVSSSEPSVGESNLVGLGTVLIAGGNIVTANNNLSGPIRRQQVTLLIHNGDLGSRGYANRPRLTFARGQRVTGDLMRSLRHSIAFDHGDMERIFKFEHDSGGQGGGGRADNSQRR